MKLDDLVADSGRFEVLLRQAAAFGPIKTGVVHPCQQEALAGAVQAAQSGLITPVFFAPAVKLGRIAEQAGIDLSAYPVIDVPHSHAAAHEAVAWAGAHKLAALMKGSLHTDELMSAALNHESALRTERRASHVFVLDVPSYSRLLLMSDGAINIQPDLEAKADIVRNAIDLAHALGIAEPRVAILSALETVTPKIVATVDAAALCKMAERGQITGAVVDGPFAFDNAISAEAARIKGIDSPVPGNADILIAPDLESGNLLVKQLEYLAGARTAGLVMGLKVPIMLTSRADPVAARLASCALAVLQAHYQVSRQ
jgi:phosphate acetyltransferase